jgi:hypothetical protein
VRRRSTTLVLFRKKIGSKYISLETAVNRGAAGVGESIERFEARAEAYLAELSESLRTGQYRPMAIRRVEIPKGDGTLRPLGIPAVKDRIAQTAVKLVIEPIFEAAAVRRMKRVRQAPPPGLPCSGSNGNIASPRAARLFFNPNCTYFNLTPLRFADYNRRKLHLSKRKSCPNNPNQFFLRHERMASILSKP